LANRFDSVNYPTNVPDTLYVGDNFLWKRDLTDYPVASYSLSYSFRLLTSAATEIALGDSVITESDTSVYTINVPSSTTTDYTKGDYTYQEYITKTSGSERLVLNTGLVSLKSNLDADTGDPRSSARIILQALEATMENRATIDQMSMSIAGRSLSRMSPAELNDWKSHYKALVSNEDKKSRRDKSEATGTQIKVRF
jgi:hypothetical protein|tara:strand:- start:22117 stop:22707 length:591 start_codon:yes stop_codon:yes gene_type:complete